VILGFEFSESLDPTAIGTLALAWDTVFLGFHRHLERLT
jgi:hypothetical protein